MGLLGTIKTELSTSVTSLLYGDLAASTEATTKAINAVLDAVNNSESVELAFNTSMIAANIPTVYKNNHGGGSFRGTTTSLINVIFSGMSKVTNLGGATTSRLANKLYSNLSTAANRTVDAWEQALVQPNIAGVPISTESVSTSRDVDISESMVISQSSGSKLYMTDNAVPRLKEWVISGYLTSSSLLDAGFLIKPSLVWQLYYLDVCAKSRRPVMFKTNKGEFVKVQITNLSTSEDATYNNCVKVSITLKEYNPYVAETATTTRLMGILQ